MTDAPIAIQVEQVKKASSTRLPVQVNTAFDAEIGRLVAAGVPGGVAAAGSKMPDGELLDATGRATSLSQARAGRPAVVVFYRGTWCPYCNVTLRAYQEGLAAELEVRGVALIAISPQKPDGSLTMTQKNELSYPVLSDPGLAIAERLGIVFTPSREAIKAQAGLGLHLTDVNADGTARLPLATTVVIDQDGIIGWIDVHPDYTTRSEPAQILAALDALRGSAAPVTAGSQELVGRTALVTGAGRGIGRAVAVGLAQAGVRVALVARSIPELEQTAHHIDELGGRAFVLPADLADRGQVAALADRANADLGNIDILINNAAVVAPLGPTGHVDRQQWAAAIEINVIAPVTLALLLLGGMCAAGWGRIVNVSSSIAEHPAAMPGMNAYATSKAAIEAHTLNLAAELAGTGVSVNAFRPGSVDTAMQSWIRDQDPQRIGGALHQRFVRSYQQGTLITAPDSAAVLIAQLPGQETGQIWDAARPG